MVIFHPLTYWCMSGILLCLFGVPWILCFTVTEIIENKRVAIISIFSLSFIGIVSAIALDIFWG